MRMEVNLQAEHLNFTHTRHWEEANRSSTALQQVPRSIHARLMCLVTPKNLVDSLPHAPQAPW